MTRYTTWSTHEYNGLTIYLTDAPANARYIEPSSTGSLAEHPVDELVESTGPLPDLPGASLRGVTKSPRCAMISRYLREHGAATAREIADAADPSARRAITLALILNPHRFERTGATKWHGGHECPVWRLRDEEEEED